MPYQYFKSDSFAFDFNNVLGGTAYQLADAGECFATASRIKDEDYDSWYDEWTATGDRVRAIADQSAAQGHTASARDAYLRAARYYASAFFFVLGTRDPSRELTLWKLMRACFDNAIARWATPIEQVEIPYENTTLKGYLFLADKSGARRPLIILNNGSDGQVMEMLAYGAVDAVARGYNALVFDGPGQGEALYVQNLPFRYDWEKVITPIVDWAVARKDVDANKIALYGISQAGYWVPRAVAFEHRIAAAAADPGVMQVWTTWWNIWVNQLPPEMKTMLANGDKATFDEYMAEGLKQQPPESGFQFAKRAEPYGTKSYYDLLTLTKQYDLTQVVGQIKCPVWIADPEGEQFWPGQSKQLYDALTCPKTLVPFTAAEGADTHC